MRLKGSYFTEVARLAESLQSCTHSSSFASKGVLGPRRASGYEICGLNRSRHRRLARPPFSEKRTDYVFDRHFLHVDVADIAGLK
jgi:hypothetical protein